MAKAKTAKKDKEEILKQVQDDDVNVQGKPDVPAGQVQRHLRKLLKFKGK